MREGAAREKEKEEGATSGQDGQGIVGRGAQGPSLQSVRLAPHLPRPDVHLPVAHWPAHLLAPPPRQ